MFCDDEFPVSRGGKVDRSSGVKVEVRRVGRSLGIGEELIGRHPFPGPGLAIRILGEITPERVEILQNVDKIYIDALREHGLYDQVWQAGVILLPVKSVGVMGDERTYESCVALRAVASTDGMTADWLWTDSEGLVSGVALDTTSGDIFLTVGEGRGNALVALLQDGKVVWFWHVWVTDAPQTMTYGNGTVCMDRNLGATGTTAGGTDAYGMYYQWGRKDPFYGYKMAQDETDPVFLTYPELKSIMEKEFTIPRLALVRDIFVFAAFTGLAFANVSTLTKDNLVQDNNGDWWIRKGRVKLERRHRASSVCNIPLLPVPLAILKKYEEHPICRKKSLCLPVICNLRMSSYLKEIADLCNIRKNLTTHTARHTFAPPITLANKVPLQDVSVMLGHASTRMTQHYARVLNPSLKEAMDNVRNALAQ